MTHYNQAVIAEPIEVCRKAGAKTLRFDSAKEAAFYFGMKINHLYHRMKYSSNKPMCGFNLRFEEVE